LIGRFTETFCKSPPGPWETVNENATVTKRKRTALAFQRQARSGVGRFEVPGQPMYILRPGASEDQARHGSAGWGMWDVDPGDDMNFSWEKSTKQV